MHRVLRLAFGKALAQRALGRLGGVGCTDQVAEVLHRILLLQDGGQYGPAGHVPHQFPIERTFLVYGIELPGFLLRKLGIFHGDQTESAGKDHVQDLAGMSCCHGFRLDHGERSVACHRRMLKKGRKSSPLPRAPHPIPMLSSRSPADTLVAGVTPARTMRHTYALAALLVLLFSCSSPTTGTEGRPETLVIGGDDASAHTDNLYQMPTPNELFQIVRTMSGEGQKRMMSPAKNVERYATRQKKALNFGVYATDLVYASTYKITSEVVRYYLTCKKLGDALGLAGSFSDADFVRLERNLTHGDSLDVISNEAYERAYRRMQDERMGP